jgi:hypothetical protein
VKCPEKPSRLPGLAAVHVGLENDTDLLAVAGVQEERWLHRMIGTLLRVICKILMCEREAPRKLSVVFYYN